MYSNGDLIAVHGKFNGSAYTHRLLSRRKKHYDWDSIQYEPKEEICLAFSSCRSGPALQGGLSNLAASVSRSPASGQCCCREDHNNPILQAYTTELWVTTSDLWLVTCDKWLVTCDLWLVTWDLWAVTCDWWLVTSDLRLVINDLRFVPSYLWLVTCEFE